jgi:hypothetical protein
MSIVSNGHAQIKTGGGNGAAKARHAEIGTSPNSAADIFTVSIADIKLAKVNDLIYGEIDPHDKSLDGLVCQLKNDGQLVPVVLTLDDVLLSGHRRRAAAMRLKWKMLKACRHPIYSTDPDFERLLVAHNEQRDKSPDVLIREQLVLADPEKAYQELVAERADASRVKAEPLELGAARQRARITGAKKPFLDAIKRVIEELEDYWPLSDRKIHYSLLNDPPLIHAAKLASRYRNDHASYKACCELLTRARIAEHIPHEAIGDETRPVVVWDVHPNVAAFIRREVEGFCKGYWRDLMQSQPNHFEIVGEKLTVEAVVRPVAERYCIPYTIGRGYSSLPPRKAMFDRWRNSHKDKLAILFLSDHDPEGWDIPEVFAKSMRDDFGVREIVPVKVALKPEQVRQLGLQPNADAKKTSSRYKKFARLFGPAAYELEAVPPPTLESWLDEAVRSVINPDRFNDQVEAERRDAARIRAFRQASRDHLKAIQFVEEDA